jgi:hypothetical protein
MLIVDGFPMTTAHFKRANKSNNFKGESGYGFCASKSETYYSQHFAPIEVHSVILSIGVIMKHRCQLNHARTFY